MNKELLRKTNFVSEEVSGEKFILEYFLTKNEHSFKSGNIKFLCYGVEIAMRNENQKEYCETKMMNEIFSSKELAVEFINKLADGVVTPCTLENVISDTLTEALSN